MMLGTMLEESGVRQDTVIFISIVRQGDLIGDRVWLKRADTPISK
jgi:hypothetical protein